jgi:hypothetical protein
MKYIQWSGLANRGLNVFVNTNYDKLTLEKVTDKLLSEILFGDGHEQSFRLDQGRPSAARVRKVRTTNQRFSL